MTQKCAICGKEEARVIDKNGFICLQCNELYGTCSMCNYGLNCEFFNNPSPIPKFVVQQVTQKTQNGYVQQICKVPNPERVKAFCQDQCICLKEYDGIMLCSRQFNTCKNYTEIQTDKSQE